MSPQSSNFKGLAFHERKNPDDVVITMAIRSPMTKARKGGFKDTRIDELLTEIIKVSTRLVSPTPSILQLIALARSLQLRPCAHRRYMRGQRAGSQSPVRAPGVHHLPTITEQLLVTLQGPPLLQRGSQKPFLYSLSIDSVLPVCDPPLLYCSLLTQIQVSWQ
jgi:hypothetical protein